MLRYESTRTSCSFYCSYPIVLYLYVHVACRSGVLSLRRSQHSGCRHLVASHGRLLLPQRGSECVRKSTLPGTRQTANGRFSHPSITSMAPLSTAPTSQTPDIIDTPSWDTSPNTFPQYYTKLLKWLPRQESKYTTLAQYYYVLSRGQVCCVSVNHAARAASKMLVKGSFKNPQHVRPTDMLAAPPLSSPPVAPPTPGSPGSGTAAGPTAGPPPTPLHSGTSPSEPASNNRSRYVENFEIVDQCASELYTLIADTVEDEYTMDELLSAIGERNGILLLIHWSKKFDSDDASSIYATSILDNMKKIEEVGLTSTSVSEFNTFKRLLNAERLLLPSTDPCSDTAFATKLVTAVRNLGPLVRS